MSFHYSNPKRASEQTALPNVEVFYFKGGRDVYNVTDYVIYPRGWYWQPCFPGCLPDGDPVGPFDTEREALADAQGGEP